MHLKFLLRDWGGSMTDPSTDSSEQDEVANGAGSFGLKHPCRVCGKPIKTTEVTFPFCSDRCRLVDLGKWFNES